VTPDDWARFLRDITAAGSNPGTMEKTIATVAPFAKGVRILGAVAGVGPLFGLGADQKMRSFKTGPVAEVVDHWNYYFFGPREIDVALAQGRLLYTGRGDGLPADMYLEGHQGGRYFDEDPSDSSSSDNERPGRRDRRERKKEKKAARKQRRSEKRSDKRSKHNLFEGANENWRIVVSYRPTMRI